MTPLDNQQPEQHRIDQFFDRTLTPEQETDFLISLTTSKPMRELFRAEILLLQAGREPDMSTHVPNDFTNDLFAGLHLPSPGMRAGIAARDNRKWKGAAAIIFLLLGGFGIGYGVNGWQHHNEHNNSNRITEPSIQKSVQASDSEVTPGQTQIALSTNKQRKKIKSPRTNKPASKSTRAATVVTVEHSSATEEIKQSQVQEKEGDKPFEIRVHRLQIGDSVITLPKK